MVSLTPRQYEAGLPMAMGRTTRETASAMGVALSTANHHRLAVLYAFRDRVAAVKP